MVACKMRVELFDVIGIYLRPPFVYHQSIMVSVKVDIDALIEVSNLNILVSPYFSVSRDNLVHLLMILKMEGNDNTRKIENSKQTSSRLVKGNILFFHH